MATLFMYAIENQLVMKIIVRQVSEESSKFAHEITLMWWMNYQLAYLTF